MKIKVLIADDDDITLQLLEHSLSNMNFEIVLAHDGNEAWQKLQEEPIEIAILDWMMPGSDGLEICRRLRAQPDLHFIYIILLTANDRSEDVIAGLDSGANDYIIKPFDLPVLKSRIAMAARVVEYETRVQKMNEELLRYSIQMEMLAMQRAKQLVQADRMVILGTMAAGIAHEINNPLTILQGNIKLLERVWNTELRTDFQAAEQDHKPLLSSESITGLMTTLENAVLRIRNIVDGMRNFSHGKGGEVKDLDPVTCLQDALSICLPKTKQLVDVKTEVEAIPFVVKGNPVQITQVLVNLIGNAADSLNGTAEPELKLGLHPVNGRLHYTVQDNGPGILAENIEKLWSPFFTTKPVGVGTGLGLFICRSIMEEHGGRILVTSQPKIATVFTVELPSATEYETVKPHHAPSNSEE